MEQNHLQWINGNWVPVPMNCNDYENRAEFIINGKNDYNCTFKLKSVTLDQCFLTWDNLPFLGNFFVCFKVMLQNSTVKGDL